MKHEFTVVFERGDGDWWIATALEIPGAFSQGKTIDEAREMLLDAVGELKLAEAAIITTLTNQTGDSCDDFFTPCRFC